MIMQLVFKPQKKRSRDEIFKAVSEIQKKIPSEFASSSTFSIVIDSLEAKTPIFYIKSKK